MKYQSLIYGHIFIDEEGKKDIELLNWIENDDSEIFDGVRESLLENIDIGESEDYDFIAIVKAETVIHRGFDYTEYDVEHYVTEIKTIEDLYKSMKE